VQGADMCRLGWWVEATRTKIGGIVEGGDGRRWEGGEGGQRSEAC
jgi:hypothetical protein